MSNTLALTTPISMAPLTHVRIDRAEDVNDTTGKLTLMLELYIPPPEGGNWDLRTKHHRDIGILVSNTKCTRLTVNPANAMELVSTEELLIAEHPELANAWTRVMGKYQLAKMQGQDGNNAMLAELVVLGLIPGGTTG